MTNTTINTLQTTQLNKTFYDRQLLESARTRFVHAKFGQMRPIPRNRRQAGGIPPLESL